MISRSSTSQSSLAERGAPTPADLNARKELFASNLLGKRFGSHQHALLAAGLVPARRAWTRADVIDAFTRFQREHGRLPTSTDLRATRGSGYPPASAVRALFGDLHSAQRACGYSGPPRRSRFHPDDAVRALRHFHTIHGRHPSVREWDQLGQRPSAPAIIRHYGSWNAALSAAGLIVTQPRRRWSDDDILAAIRAFETGHDRPPRTADFGGPTMPGFETVRVRFGSLAASIARAREPR
jgi:Homing endonuclease associated repeat